jgi:hypothetical protein
MNLSRSVTKFRKSAHSGGTLPHFKPCEHYSTLAMTHILECGGTPPLLPTTWLSTFDNTDRSRNLPQPFISDTTRSGAIAPHSKAQAHYFAMLLE